LDKAEEADSTPLQDGLTIPAEIARREDRQARLESARLVIEEREKERTQSEAQQRQAEYESKTAARQAKRERGETVRGREPQPPSPAGLDAKAQYNFTDPESRIMKAGNGKHFEQAFNAQAAVSTESLLIVGQRVCNAANDKEQLLPTFESIPQSLGPVHTVIADAGYYSETQIEQVAASERALPPARDELGTSLPESSTVVYVAAGRIGHTLPLADIEDRPDAEAPPPHALMKERMQHRLRTKEGKAIYKQRKCTVEPVFGIIKSVLGFRRFSLRGQEKVSSEWTLVCLAWNLKRLHKLGMPALMRANA